MMKRRRSIQRAGMILFSILLVAVLLPLPIQRASATQGDVPAFEDAPCMVMLLPGLEEGRDVQCGYVTVPEQYDQPDGPTIRLAVVILKSQVENPRSDPLVMMQGGPGGSTIEYYTLQILTTRRLLTDRDIVLFDQRGTLYSEPSLDCPEYMDLVIETLDDDLSDEKAEELFLQSMTECRQRLTQEGVNLSAFDSVENASDVESVRQALGYDQINLYGVSYGTLLALHVMRQHPQGLRSVIIDSVVPPQVNFLVDVPQSQDRSFVKLFEACAADEACSRAYPDLENVFYQLVDQLNADPVMLQLTDLETGLNHDMLFDGDQLIGALFQMLYVTDLIPLLPRVIYEVRAGNYSFIERILSSVVFDRSMSLGMYYSVLCAEDADFDPEDIDLTGLPPQVKAYQDLSGESFQNTCQVWDVEILGPTVDEPVSSDVPTLVLNGGFDPITPPAYGEEAAETLSNSFLFTFPAGGHGAATSGECQDAIILDFIANPQQEPDAACIAGIEQVEFATPGALVRLPALPLLLNLQGTSGIEMALYGLALLFLLSALLVYPIVWLVRLLTRRPAPVAVPPAGTWQGEGPVYETAAPAISARERRPLTWRLAPWLASLIAVLLTTFSVILVAVIVGMVARNDLRILMGLPGSTIPLFILLLLTALLVVAMFVLAVFAWLRGWGSVWGRIYFTLLSLAAVTIITITGIWGMLTALFT